MPPTMTRLRVTRYCAGSPRRERIPFWSTLNDTGSTATEYTDHDVTPDVRHTYRVKAINAVGISRRSDYVRVTPTQPAEPSQNSPATGRPTIGGTVQVGEELTASTSGMSDTDGLTNVSYGYQWIRNDGTADTDITDATDSTYTLVAADEGNTIKVKVSFADDADNEETLTSTSTEAVSFAVQQQTANSTGHGQADHQRHGSGGGGVDGVHLGHRGR